jgi:hypothetical protein
VARFTALQKVEHGFDGLASGLCVTFKKITLETVPDDRGVFQVISVDPFPALRKTDPRIIRNRNSVKLIEALHPTDIAGGFELTLGGSQNRTRKPQACLRRLISNQWH